jgi:hypothetical protein
MNLPGADRLDGAYRDRARAELRQYRDRTRAWLRWFLFGDTTWNWLRPRRALLPALSFWSLYALFGLHRPLGRAGSKCSTVDACSQVLAEIGGEGPGELFVLAGFYLLAATTVYVLAVGVTGLAGHFVDLRARYPWLFAPDDEELLAVVVVLVGAVLTYAAGVVGAAYSVLGLAVLYVVYFPSLALTGVLAYATFTGALAGVPDPLGTVVGLAAGLAFVVVAPAAQVLWLYALAHGAVRAIQAEL